MMATAAVDHAVVNRARAVLAGLEPRPPRRPRIPKVADILACTFDASADAFRIVYADDCAFTLSRSELADVDGRTVAAWSVDEFARGVEVVLMDGTVTSFSAEYPRYLRDADYRARVDEGRSARDLGARVATRVMALREERGWTVAELARRCDMAAPNLHRLESGKHVPTTTTLLRVAEALDVPLTRLLRADASRGE